MSPKIKGRKVGDVDYFGNPRVQTVNDEPSLTVQSDGPQADIRQIMAQYLKTGQVDLDRAEGMFMDVSEFTDFADVQRQSKEAEVQFLRLPSKVREIFDHNVANWLDTAHDDDKRQKLIDAGFLEGEKTEADREGGEVVDEVAVDDVEVPG